MIQVKTAQRIKSLLKEYGMKQRELARLMRVSDASISQWANGVHVPIVEDVALLAEIFHTTTDYLIGVSDERSRR